MRFLIIALLLVAFASARSAAALRDDPALDKPVTLAVKGEALSDVVRMLQKKTGAWLRVSRDIADQKVTVLVDNQPLRDVMGGVSRVFGFAWRQRTLNEHPVHELCETIAGNRRREAKLRESADAAWAKLLADIHRDYELTGKTQAEIDKALRTDPNDELMADDDLRRMAVEHLTSRQSKSMLRFVCQLPDAVLAALRSGDKVYYDSASPEDEWKLTEDLKSALIAEASELSKPILAQMEGPRIELGGDLAETDLDDIKPEEDLDGEIDLERAEDEFPAFEHPGEPKMQPDRVNLELSLSDRPGQLSLDYTATLFAGDRYTFRCGNTIDSVGTYELRSPEGPGLPHQPNAQLMAKKVGCTRADYLREADLPKHLETEHGFGEVNRSDVLAVLHQKLGLQAIADHYTNWRYAPEGTNLTLRQVLDDLAKKNGPMDLGRSDYKSTWGADSRFVYFRLDDPPSADPWEVPNRLLRPWQEKYAQKHALDLNDYAQMALLSPEQRDTITTNCQRLQVGHPDTFGMPMYGSDDSDNLLELPALRLYGLLSQRQRREAALRGVPVAAFTPYQYGALQDLVARQRRLKRTPDPAPRVGVFHNGIRIDKPGPETQQGPLPSLLEFRLAKSKGGYYREVVSKMGIGGEEGEVTSSVTVKASSFEQAWEKVKSKVPPADKHRLYYSVTQTYRVKVTFEDGTTLGTWPEISSRLTFEDYQAEKDRQR